MRNDTESIHGPTTGLLTRLIVLALFVAALGSWLLSNSPGTQPDDSFHFANTWCPDGVDGFACETLADGRRLVPDSFVEGSPWWETTSLLPAIGELSQYPQLQNNVMRLLATDDVYQSVVMMRMFNLAVALFFVAAAFVLVGPGGRMAVSLTWLSVPIAQGYFLVASNHPISWYYTGIGTLWAFVLGVIRARSKMTRWLSAMFAVASSVMAIGSRPEGQLLVAFTIAVTLLFSVEDPAAVCSRVVRFMKNESGRRRALWFALTLSVISVGLLLLSRLGTKFTGEMIRAIPQSFSDLRSLLDTPRIYFNAVTSSIGVSEAPTSGLQTIPAGLIVGFVIFLGLRNMWKAKALALSLVLLAMSIAPRLIVVDERGPLFSPSRYFVAFMLVFVGLTLVGQRGNVERELSSVDRVLIVFLATVAFSLSLHGAIDPAGVINPDIWDWNLNGNLKWWWSMSPSPMTVWYVGTVCFAAGSYLLLRRFHSRAGTLRPIMSGVGVGVFGIISVLIISVWEGDFYRPPLSARPALETSKQVVWTFSLRLQNPRTGFDSSTGMDVLVLDLKDNQVGRLKNDEESHSVSAELLSESWPDINSGLEAVSIQGWSAGSLNVSALAKWSDWQLLPGETLRLNVSLTDLGRNMLNDLEAISDEQLLELEFRVRVGQCERRESLLKCPFADFSGSDLSRNDFERADLRGVDLTNARLTEAKLNGTDLSGAVLNDADLSGAYLVGVDLSESSQLGMKIEDVIWTR